MASTQHVLIVGAGISGLLLAGLLNKAGISFEVLEKAKELRPLGSGLSISPSCLYMFEQLGLYEHLMSITKPFGALHLRKESLATIGKLFDNGFLERGENDRDPAIERYGDYARIVVRSDIMDMLLGLVPPEKIRYNTKVISTTQDQDKVVVQCADNVSYTGTVLVGADGAYSTVRQNMFAELKVEGRLPKEDQEPMECDYNCLVGVAQDLDPKVYPILEHKYCEFEVILGKEIPYSWWFMPTTDNRIGWMVTESVRGKKSSTDSDKSVEKSSPGWDLDAALEMCNKVRHLPTPYGGTVGDMIDNTPKGLVSKVMLENKLFKTWYHKRTVLLGDACHKMVPFGGQGANAAILAALEIANQLYEIDSSSQKDVTKAFENYYSERFQFGKDAVSGSNQSGYMMHQQGRVADFVRHAALNWVPKMAFDSLADIINYYRPQAIFLPFVSNRGTFQPKANQASQRADAPAENRMHAQV